MADWAKTFTPPDYVVDGMIQRSCFYSMTGRTGSGKTGIAVHMSATIGHPESGQTFGPYEVAPGRVLYIPAENQTDVLMRFIGLAHVERIDLHNLHILIESDARRLTLDFKAEFPRLTECVKPYGELSLVIVDTAPAMFPGDDENSNVQMRDHAKRLRELTGLPGSPATIALCHPPKTASAPERLVPRGGGAYIAEVDGNFSVWDYGDRLADLHWCGKFRGPDFAKITFRHETVTTPELVDHRGRALPTVVAQVVEAETTAAGAISEDGQLLAAMLNRPQGTLEEWAADCGWFTQGDAKRPNKSLAK